MILYRFYKLLSILLIPFARLNLLYRVFKNKEDPKRYTEKLGKPSFKRPSGQLIWFHAASIGELNSIIPLVKKLTSNNIWVLVTTVTTSSAKVFRDAELDKAIHQFAPIDTPLFVKRFLRHWKPNLTIFVDSELWPNLICMAKNINKMLLVNARLSDKSFKLWQNFPFFAEFIYSKFNHIFSASLDDTRKISHFYDEANISYIGNLKYVGDDKAINKKALSSLKSQTEGRQIFLAASTHRGEEEYIFEAHRSLKKKHPNLLTIVVPRHHYVGESIKNLAHQYKLKTAIRSLNHNIEDKTDIYIADTLGELQLFYKLAEIVFVGGSLVKHGGQNIIEAARDNSAIIVGPYTSNFRQIVNEFLLEEALLVVNSKKSLTHTLDTLFSNSDLRKKMSLAALNIATSKQKILDLTYKKIEGYLK